MARAGSGGPRRPRRGEAPAPQHSERNGYVLQTLANGLLVLGLFDSGHPQWSVDEIGAKIGAQRMTVYRLTRTLEHMGFLALDPVGGEYRLGPAMLGARYLTGRYADLVRVARPYLEALAQKTGETVTLAVEIEKVSVAIDILRTSRPFMSEMDLGCVVGDTANTNGKLFAAYKPVAEKERLAAGPNRQWTPRTITEPSQLLEELEKVRREGVAFDIEERFLGTCAVGAPVRNQLGDLVAVMSVVVPTGRFGAEERKGHGEAVKAAAASLSAYLGFSPESA